VHLQLPSRRGRVDALGEGDERDTQGLKLLEEHYQVLQTATQAVETPYLLCVLGPGAACEHRESNCRPSARLSFAPIAPTQTVFGWPISQPCLACWGIAEPLTGRVAWLHHHRTIPSRLTTDCIIPEATWR
jgi:hypothetical protein